jgi:hypothetical protein
MYVFSVEALTQFAFDHIDDDAGMQMCDDFLRATYRQCPLSQLIGHIARLTDQMRIGFAVIAAETLVEQAKSHNARIEQLAKNMIRVLRMDIPTDVLSEIQLMWPDMKRVVTVNRKILTKTATR